MPNINKPLYKFIKRVFDIISSLTLIILISWLLIILYLIVMFTSGHPVIYRDKRIGKNGEGISVFKFRTMVKNAESRIKEYLTPDQYEIWKKERKLDFDPRITKIGRFLRKTSLDELPQLFNILFGSMSVVGPRPITEFELNQFFNDDQKSILLSARPGLISYWSINGRSNISFLDGERQRLELEYFSKCSCLFDLKLIFKSIPVVISEKGAK